MNYFLLLCLALCVSAHATPKIVGGNPVNLNQDPRINFQLGLSINVFDGGSSRCGGVIIDTEWALTAAHCLYSRESGRLTTSASRITAIPGLNYDDLSNAVSVSEFFIPDSYLTGSSLAAQDIAVLHLSSNLTFSNAINRVALPSSICGSCTGTGTNYIVSGYGLTICPTNGACNTLSDTLQYVGQEWVSDSTCLQAYSAQGINNVALPAGVICAGMGSPPPNPRTDSCQGDSGGPLVVDQGVSADPRYLLAGIVSGGTAQTNPACAVVGQYGLYTGVSVNRPYIDAVLAGQVQRTSAASYLSPAVALLLAVALALAI